MGSPKRKRPYSDFYFRNFRPPALPALPRDYQFRFGVPLGGVQTILTQSHPCMDSCLLIRKGPVSCHSSQFDRVLVASRKLEFCSDQFLCMVLTSFRLSNWLICLQFRGQVGRELMNSTIPTPSMSYQVLTDKCRGSVWRSEDLGVFGIWLRFLSTARLPP